MTKVRISGSRAFAVQVDLADHLEVIQRELVAEIAVDTVRKEFRSNPKSGFNQTISLWSYIPLNVLPLPQHLFLLAHVSFI